MIDVEEITEKFCIVAGGAVREFCDMVGVSDVRQNWAHLLNDQRL